MAVSGRPTLPTSPHRLGKAETDPTRIPLPEVPNSLGESNAFAS
jgi:hypothetical protein